jgi:hypothetical protein
LRGGKGGGGTTKFVCQHDCHQGKPYTGSYKRARRHLCGVMESDDNKGAIGISICPKISKKERQKYIKIEEVAQRKYGEKQKLHSDASSKFGGNTSTSPHGSTTSDYRRTRTDFLDIEGRDEVDAKVVRFLYACGLPFNMLHSPYWHDLVKGINEAPKGYKSPNYEKARTVLLDRERVKIQRALTRFTDEWGDFGVSIVSDGWKNVRNQHLINILGVSATGAVFLAAHDSSIIASSQNIVELLLKTINDVGPVTLPSLGVTRGDHVSRPAMENTIHTMMMMINMSTDGSPAAPLICFLVQINQGSSHLSNPEYGRR